MRDFSASGLGPLMLLLAVPSPLHRAEMLSKQKSGKDLPKKGGSFPGASLFLLKLSQTKRFLIKKRNCSFALCFMFCFGYPLVLSLNPVIHTVPTATGFEVNKLLRRRSAKMVPDQNDMQQHTGSM